MAKESTGPLFCGPAEGSRGISGEVWGVRALSYAFSAMLGGLGLVAAYDYGMAHDGSMHVFWRQSVHLTAGLLLMTGLSLAPRLHVSERLRHRVLWAAFALGLLLFLAGKTPGLALKINDQQRWVELFGIRMNTALWAGLLLLPGMVYWMSRPLTLKRAAALAATLLYVNLLLVNTFNMPAIFWFNSAMGVLIAASLLPGAFYCDRSSWRRQCFLRMALLVVAAFFVAAPVVKYSFRVHELFMAWMPQCQEKHDHLYHAWVVHQNFLDGGLYGAGMPFPAERIVAAQSAISDFVLQMAGYRFGALGALAVVVLCLWLAWAWLRHAHQSAVPGQRLWRLGLAAFLLIHIFGSIARTTALIPIAPPLPLPFMAFGGNITLWSFVCLGLLLCNFGPDANQLEKE